MIRVLTTLALAAFVLAGIWYFPLFVNQSLILVAIGLGLFEYSKLSFKESDFRLITLFFGVGLAAILIWIPSLETLLLGITAILFLTFLWGLKHKKPLNEVPSKIGLVLLGICYLSLTIPCWSWLFEFGRESVMLLLFPACLTDTFSFLVGKRFGKHKLAPIVSPNKTWEGFFGGLFGGIFGLWLAQKLFFATPLLSWGSLLLLGITISFLAIVGDLIESLIKRGVGVKDSGVLIPGHGGALDRLDALIFVAPAFYLIVKSGLLVR